jgi:hypothetical protein
MTSETKTGGFVGDPAEAYRPPAAGGCCGSTSEASTCCGTTEDATAADACCAPAAKAEAVASEAGCCG